MMNKMMMVIAALLSVGLIAHDADARRLGGGTSIGKQRSIQPAPTTPPKQAPSAAPTAPTQQPSGMSRWLGPLAGLALGAGLASLFFNNGLAGAFGGILMIGLIAAALMFAWRMLRSKTQARPLQYAGAGSLGAPPSQSSAPAISNAFGGAAAPAIAATRYPPGFDVEQFVHHAKLNFTQLQAANDKRDLSTMRDFMTPDIYAEIAAELNARGDAPQQTDVVTLDAEVIEVVTEGEAYIASVRFSGMIRERADAAAEPFSEIWHLEKPLNGATGWLIAGIQQD
jgi:predicted lipid-binding transport protein (Tim44 family)